MWEKWTRLCEANVKHYNEHPGEHMAIVVGILAVGVVAIGAMVRSANNEPRYPYGMRYTPKV